MTAADASASRPADVPSTRDPAARAAVLAQLREYHRMEAEAEDAVDRAVVEDLHMVLADRTAADRVRPAGR